MESSTNSEHSTKQTGLHGALDVIGSRQAMGWVVDLDEPDTPLEVVILRDGKKIAQTVANVERPDLATNGIGTGKHGFIVDFETPLESGFEFTIRALAQSKKGVVILPRFDPASQEVSPQARILEHVYLTQKEMENNLREVMQKVDQMNKSKSSQSKTSNDVLIHRIDTMRAQIENINLLIERGFNSEPRAKVTAWWYALLIIAAIGLVLFYAQKIAA